MSAPEGMQPQQPPATTPTQFSGDGNYWWDGKQWISTLSPDGKYRWTGTQWAPVRKMLFGDHANQSIASAIIGIFCAPFFLFGLWAGYKAYQELPHKRTQSIVGIVLNACGGLIWALSLVYRFVVAPALQQ